MREMIVDGTQDEASSLTLSEFGDGQRLTPPIDQKAERTREETAHAATCQDMEAIYNVQVKVQAILGRARLEVGELLRLRPGDIVPLDRRVGEAIDIFVNNRQVARGEVVLIDNGLGVTMTEIVKQDR